MDKGQTHMVDDIMSGTQVALGIRGCKSKELQDIRVLDSYMDHIQKQYTNVSNKKMGLIMGLFYGEGLILVNTRCSLSKDIGLMMEFNPQGKYQRSEPTVQKYRPSTLICL